MTQHLSAWEIAVPCDTFVIPFFKLYVIFNAKLFFFYPPSSFTIPYSALLFSLNHVSSTSSLDFQPHAVDHVWHLLSPGSPGPLTPDSSSVFFRFHEHQSWFPMKQNMTIPGMSLSNWPSLNIRSTHLEDRLSTGQNAEETRQSQRRITQPCTGSSLPV